MSAAVREALADAANAVQGVNVAPYFRPTTKVGDGYVLLSRIDYPNRLGGVTTWQVLVNLPQNLLTAEKWLDEHVDDLVTAVGAELIVTSAEPIQLDIGTGLLPVVAITGNREQE